MTTRIIAVSILVLLAGFIGVMGAVTFFVRDPLPIIAPNQTLVLGSATLTPPVQVEVMIDGRYRVGLTVSDPASPPAQIRLRPVNGTPIPIEELSRGAGSFTGGGQLTRPGRWEVVLERPGQQDVLPFIVQE